jgi:hypothetical protein
MIKLYSILGEFLRIFAHNFDEIGDRCRENSQEVTKFNEASFKMADFLPKRIFASQKAFPRYSSYG